MMRSPKYAKWLSGAAVAVCIGIVLPVCETVAADQTRVRSQIPPSFNAAVFDDLEGPVVWYSTSGGQSDRDRLETVFGNFQKLTGVRVIADFHPTMAPFWAGVQAERVPWDLLMFDGSASTAISYNKGLLAPIDPEIVPVHLLAPGQYDKKYLIEGFKWATILTWNTNKWPVSGLHPDSMADFYDTEKFPGPRCLYNQPQAGGVLESAVLAAGVPPSEVYPIDTEVAFAKLDTIKDDVVWYNGGDEAIRFLSTGECVMGITWNTRVYKAIRDGNAPLAFTWKGATYAPQLFAIPKNAPHPKAAQALMAWMILDRIGNKEMTMRTLGYMFLKDPLDVPPEITRFIPTADKLTHAVRENGGYYAEHLNRLNKEFRAWLVE